MDSPQTVSELLESFQQFLVVVIHNILYCRGVYPAESFERVRIYDIVVYESRHYRVRDWIEQLSDSCIKQISEGNVKKISIVILRDRDRAPLERFVLDLRTFPQMDPLDQGERVIDMGPISWSSIEQEYRSCIRTLFSTSEELGKACNETVTFTALLEAKEEAGFDSQMTTKEDSPWISADYSKHGPSRPLIAKPIRFANNGPTSFNFYMEESKTKQKMPKSTESEQTT